MPNFMVGSRGNEIKVRIKLEIFGQVAEKTNRMEGKNNQDNKTLFEVLLDQFGDYYICDLIRQFYADTCQEILDSCPYADCKSDNYCYDCREAAYYQYCAEASRKRERESKEQLMIEYRKKRSKN